MISNLLNSEISAVKKSSNELLVDNRHSQAEAVSTSECPAGTENVFVSLPAIFGLFFQIGMLSFGGGLSAWLYREIVERRCWLTPADFLSGLALGQILPGINTANLSIYTGQRLRGVPGATVALSGLLFAPFFIIIGLATVYAQIEAISWAHNFLCGVATAAVGLLLSVPLKSVRHAMRGIGPFAILVFIVITVGLLRWPMVPVVLCVTPISVALAWRAKGEGNAR